MKIRESEKQVNELKFLDRESEKKFREIKLKKKLEYESTSIKETSESISLLNVILLIITFQKLI